MRKALFGSKKSLIMESESNSAIPDAVKSSPSIIISSADFGIQTEVATRTIGISTETMALMDAQCITDERIIGDAFTQTEMVSACDSYIQVSTDHREIGVDPGEWNQSIVRGIDIQTDSPNPEDPLFWISGSREDIRTIITNLLARIEKDDLSSSSSKEPRDTLQFHADNVLLRLEIAELKRRLSDISRMKSLEFSPILNPLITRASTAGLTGGYSSSSAFIVDVDDGLPVTSSLAPSSFIIGRLRKGDKVLTAGPPEEIGSLIRGPVLPRGWITLRDANTVYLRRP